LGSWNAPAGRPELVSSPAPSGRLVTLAGMSATAQRQKLFLIDDIIDNRSSSVSSTMLS
jgi:hypothetical protein